MTQTSNPQGTKATAGRTLTLWQLMCFGVLTMPLAMGGVAFALFIPTFYAVDVGLGLTAVGVIFAAGRLLDVFTDPAIGHLSDETRSRWGARRPWIILGAPLYCIAV
jgi:GPH family glycoside/pentoside/hexuronide:cation symporter